MDGKKIYRLTPEDLLEHPIWVLSMDVATLSDSEEEDWDDDTALVVPLPSDPGLVARLHDNCFCFARASFIAADGRRFIGMLKCGSGEKVEGSHPFIVTREGLVDFYSGIAKPSAEQLAADLERLGTSSENLFPMTYRPDVSWPDGPPGGALEGFYYLESRGRDHQVKYVR